MPEMSQKDVNAVILHGLRDVSRWKKLLQQGVGRSLLWKNYKLLYLLPESRGRRKRCACLRWSISQEMEELSPSLALRFYPNKHTTLLMGIKLMENL
jgi:hypothetical protein